MDSSDSSLLLYSGKGGKSGVRGKGDKLLGEVGNQDILSRSPEDDSQNFRKTRIPVTWVDRVHGTLYLFAPGSYLLFTQVIIPIYLHMYICDVVDHNLPKWG